MSLSYPNHSLSEMAFEGGRDSMGEALRESQDTQGAMPLTCEMRRIHKLCLNVVILGGLMFSCLDTTIVSTALLKISTELGNDYLNAPWVILAYLLTYMGFAVCIAKLSDIYGRCSLAIVSWAFFSCFSFGCGFAQTMPQLIICRALQGIGGSGLYSLAQISLIEIGPRAPGTVGALIGITLSISYILGPLLGGAIGNNHWRWIFFMNIPAGFIASAGWYFCWPGPRRQQGFWTALAKVDVLGNILLIASSTLLVYAIQQAGSLTLAWNDRTIIFCLTASGVSFVLFWFWQAVLAFKPDGSRIEPIFPIRLALRRVFMSSLITTFWVGFAYIALIINLPERFQIVNGDSPLWAGVHLLPLLGGCSFGSFVGGGVASRKNCCGIILIAGSAIQVLGSAFLWKFADVQNNMAPVFGYATVFGTGVGLCFAAATMLGSSESTGCLDLASAQGALAQGRVLGGSVGLAICTIIFNSHVQSDLATSLGPDDLAAIHRSPLAVMSLPDYIQPTVRRVYMLAFEDQMLLMTCAGAAAFLTSLASYQRNPRPMSEVMEQAATKQFASSSCGASETELADVHSVKSGASAAGGTAP